MLAMSAFVTEARSSRPGTRSITEAPREMGTANASLLPTPRGSATSRSVSATVGLGNAGVLSAVGRLPVPVCAVRPCPAADSDPFWGATGGLRSGVGVTEDSAPSADTTAGTAPPHSPGRRTTAHVAQMTPAIADAIERIDRHPRCDRGDRALLRRASWPTGRDLPLKRNSSMEGVTSGDESRRSVCRPGSRPRRTRMACLAPHRRYPGVLRARLGLTTP
jgi:hypothetical protein